MRKLTGGASESSELVPNQAPQQIKNLQTQPNKGSGSSPSVSRMDQSSLRSGNNLKYYPNGNPGGSGSGDIGFESIEWETKASCPNPDEIISNINFWNFYLNSKDCCPNIDIEFEDPDEWEFEDKQLIEISDEILSKNKLRRRLLATTLTGKLDKPVKDKNNFSTYDLQPFTFYSKEGKLLTLKNWELEKIVYAHSDDLGLLNFADKIKCPVQPDPHKYQRTECRAITDSAKKEALIRILELTISANPSYLTRKIPMPSYPSQDTLIYIDISTGGSVFFHADTGKLWSAGKVSPLELLSILSNPDFKNLN